ncbi:hypothetical protein BV898_18430 [Hypsibius exemplaris]|uniref:Uncharacterized protein n=1 Tax=Hypsibius exemplaris TaxID=2072580 RepID=A0A9X6RNH2_HYPEX|nr:hypothetical protein BV898_18430 [Hypsibius exemplaris]
MEEIEQELLVKVMPSERALRLYPKWVKYTHSSSVYTPHHGSKVDKIDAILYWRAVRRLDADLEPLLMSKRYPTMEARYRTMPYGSYDKLAFAYQGFHLHDFEYRNDNKVRCAYCGLIKSVKEAE